jgi:hypothetical protein
VQAPSARQLTRAKHHPQTRAEQIGGETLRSGRQSIATTAHAIEGAASESDVLIDEKRDSQAD